MRARAIFSVISVSICVRQGELLPRDVLNTAAVYNIGETQHLEGFHRERGAAAREDAFVRARFRRVTLHLNMAGEKPERHRAKARGRW